MTQVITQEAEPADVGLDAARLSALGKYFRAYVDDGRRARCSGSTPAEDLTVVFLTQLRPSSTYPIRPQLRRFINSALID